MAYDQLKAKRIWETVLNVPYGRVANYGLIADLAGLPGRARLVGTVMQFAPEDMQLPWHRILKSNGQIAFAAGSDMAHKQAELLRTEGIIVFNNRVRLKQYLWQPDLGELLRFEY